MPEGFTTADALRRAIQSASNALRGTTDAETRRDILLATLLLKHIHDEFGGEPEAALWERVAGAGRERTREDLVAAFEALAQAPAPGDRMRGVPVSALRHLLIRVAENVQRMSPAALVGVVEAFRGVRLDFRGLAYPELLGDGLESLLKDSEPFSRHSGEHYTPRELVRILTGLGRPRTGMRVCDPFCGTGGLLVQATAYVEEHGGDPQELFLAGQDISAGYVGLASLNLYLHRAPAQDLEYANFLSRSSEEGVESDLVLSVPPFGMRLDAGRERDVARPSRYAPPVVSGPADWVILQDMLGLVERRGGAVFSVISRGPLFRGGWDRAARSALLDADAVEAVIGLAPNLMPSTGIPACVIALRAPGRKAPERRGKVLFIDASREFHHGLSQNVLRTLHIQKIVDAYRDFRGKDAFARVVERTELARNDDSLDVHRYLDSAPPPEPQDIRAHMLGGMPVSEIKAQSALLGSYRIAPEQIFVRRYGDQEYLDFAPLPERLDARGLTELAEPRERRFFAVLSDWWVRSEASIKKLGSEGELEAVGPGIAGLRGELLASFLGSVGEEGILPSEALAAVFADWWREAVPHLKLLAWRGRSPTTEVDLKALGDDFRARLSGLVESRRRELVETYEAWQRKYGLSFREIEAQLTGPSLTLVQNNPWSAQPAWDLRSMTDPARGEERSHIAHRIHALIEMEKTVEGGLAKLGVDELAVLLPVLDPVAGSAEEVERCSLGDVINAARAGISGRLDNEPVGVPAVESRQLAGRGFTAEGLRYRRADAPPKRSEMLVSGDVLLTARVTAARGFRAMVWQEQLPSATYTRSIVRLSTDPARLLPGYLAAWLSHPSVHPRLHAQVTSSREGLFDLSVNRLLDVEIELPGLAEQQRIADEVARLSQQRELRHTQLAKLDLIKGTQMDGFLHSERVASGSAD